MRLRAEPEKKPPAENMIPLINIVFLILIFFLVASTVRPFSDREIKLAEAQDAKGTGVVARMAVLRADGSVYLGGEPVTEEELSRQFTAWAGEPERAVTLVADRGMPARQLIAFVTRANEAGLTDVKLLTRKAR